MGEIVETFTYQVPHTKRYRLIFSIWGSSNSDAVCDYDTIDEMQEEIKLIKEFYNDTPRPEKKYLEKKYRWEKRKYSISYKNGGSYWGYVAIDYEGKKILEIYKDGCRIYKTVPITNSYKYKTTDIPYYIDSKLDRRRVNDVFFRTEEDVPKDYKWDDGEYKGWLQFKWGDGKNAIGYKEEKKQKLPDNDDTIYDGDFDFEDTDCIDVKYEHIANTLESQLSDDIIKRIHSKYD